MDKREAIDRQAVIVEQLRGIKAACAGREMTKNQANDFHKLTGEFDTLAPISGTQTFDVIVKGPPTKYGEYTDEDRMEGQLTNASRPPMPGTRTTPKPGALLKPEQRMADLVQSRSGARKDELSFDRYLAGVVTQDWRGREAELEEIKAQMGEGSGALGGFLVPDSLSVQVIDMARNAARIFQAGALTLPMAAGTVFTGRVAGDPTAAWKAENAKATASDMNLERVKLESRTIMALVKTSIELIEDANGMGDVVARSLSAALALALDLAGLRGAGGLAPTGIRNQTGVTITELGTGQGQAATVDNLSEAAGRVEDANGEPNAILWASRSAGAFARVKDLQNRYLFGESMPFNVAKLLRLATNQIPTNLTTGGVYTTSEIYVGDFRQLVVGIRTAFNVEASRVAGDDDGGAFSALQLWIRAYLRADVMLQHPAHFNVLTGVTN